jgi:hypothetical protein
MFEDRLAGLVKNAHIEFQKLFTDLKTTSADYFDKNPKFRQSLAFKFGYNEFTGPNIDRNPVNFCTNKV